MKLTRKQMVEVELAVTQKRIENMAKYLSQCLSHVKVPSNWANNADQWRDLDKTMSNLDEAYHCLFQE